MLGHINFYECVPFYLKTCHFYLKKSFFTIKIHYWFCLLQSIITVTFEVPGNAKEENLNVFIQVIAVVSWLMIYQLCCYVVVAISRGWSYSPMSLDTEPSVGKGCEEQGWWLHGGHTTKGAVYSLQAYTFGQSPFLGYYIKSYWILKNHTEALVLVQIMFIYFHFSLFPLLKRSLENHCIKHDLFAQLHLVLQLKQPMHFEMLTCALYSQEFWELSGSWTWPVETLVSLALSLVS